VEAIFSAHTPSYVEVDLRAAVQVCRNAEVSVVGQNSAVCCISVQLK